MVSCFPSLSLGIVMSTFLFVLGVLLGAALFFLQVFFGTSEKIEDK